MSRTYIGIGRFATSRDGNGGSIGPDFRGSLPDPTTSAQMEEFYAARPQTSHRKVGVEVGEMVAHRGEGAIVLHEERDQHTGAIEVTLQKSDATGSGTRIQRWEPDGPRTMTMTSDKRSFD